MSGRRDSANSKLHRFFEKLENAQQTAPCAGCGVLLPREFAQPLLHGFELRDSTWRSFETAIVKLLGKQHFDLPPESDDASEDADRRARVLRQFTLQPCTRCGQFFCRACRHDGTGIATCIECERRAVDDVETRALEKDASSSAAQQHPATAARIAVQRFSTERAPELESLAAEASAPGDATAGDDSPTVIEASQESSAPSGRAPESVRRDHWNDELAKLFAFTSVEPTDRCVQCGILLPADNGSLFDMIFDKPDHFSAVKETVICALGKQHLDLAVQSMVVRDFETVGRLTMELALARCSICGQPYCMACRAGAADTFVCHACQASGVDGQRGESPPERVQSQEVQSHETNGRAPVAADRPAAAPAADLSDLAKVAEQYMGQQRTADPMSTMLADLTGGGPTHSRYFCGGNGRIQREGNLIQDMRILSVAGCLKDRARQLDDSAGSDEVARLVMQAVLYYLSLVQVGQFFLAPHRQRSGRPDAGLDELPLDEKCRVLTAVENLLLEIYQELPDGAVLTDETVIRKVQQLTSQ